MTSPPAPAGQPGLDELDARGRAVVDEVEADTRIRLPGIWRKLAYAVALGLAGFHLYTGLFGVLVGIQQRIIHVGFALALTFILRRFNGRQDTRPTLLDLFWILGVSASSAYLAYQGVSLDARLGLVFTSDIVLGAILTVAVLEATRRVVGWALPAIAALSIVYAMFGPYFPGMLGHRGFSVEDVTTILFLSTEGVYGIPAAVSATYIALFILLGALLKHSGAVSFFTDLALALFSGVRGGPAKVAVVASGLFGMISGSAIANVSSTGVITIPLMKRTGFSARFAASVEAVASSCGQFTPPIMASAAFVIAEVLGIGYIDVALGAAIPAAIYYLALFVTIDLRSARLGMRGERRADTPPITTIMLNGGYLLLVPATLVYMLAVVGYSPLRAGMYALIVNVALFLIREALDDARAPRWGVAAAVVALHAAVFAVDMAAGHLVAVGVYVAALAAIGLLAGDAGGTLGFLHRFVRKVADALAEGAVGILEVATCVACAGIIIGMLSLTGLGLRLSGMLLNIADGSLPLLLVLTMLASLVLGMGVPTLGAYIILAILVAPGLVQMGVDPLAAHLFIFYFGVISSITPPVALAAFAAAAIAGSPPMRTGLTAFRLAVPVFIVPFVMVYQPALTMQGEWTWIAVAFVSALAGASALAAALEGYWLAEMSWIERAAMAAAGVMMIVPGLYTDVGGGILIALIAAWQIHVRERDRRGARQPDAA